jgi:hypothetical protein
VIKDVCSLLYIGTISAMPQTLLKSVVRQLERERNRLQFELHRVTAALGAFGRVFMDGAKAPKATTVRKRRMSKAARERIAAAQRARWAKIRSRKAKA